MWRRVYIANTLKRKYGVVGKVAARYVLAGFSVRVEGNIIYVKGGSKLKVLGVITNESEVAGTISKLKELSDRVGAEAHVVLYGSRKWDESIISEARKNNLNIKFLRRVS